MKDIRIVDLSKSYEGNPVLDHLEVIFAAGSRTVIMGPSGCGKTTLLRLLMRLEEPDSGEITGLPRDMAAVFQEDRLCDRFSAVQNVLAVLHRKISREEIRRELGRVGLTEPDAPVSTFSGGMKRRVAIVRACMADAELVLMDEPLKGLDEETKDQTAAYIREKTSGKIFIMTTHDKEEALVMGDRIFRLG